MFKRSLLLNIICIFAWSASAFASPADTDEYADHFKNGRYNEAWQMIKDVDDSKDANLLFQKGLLLGSGALNSGSDKCGAVKKFEAAEELGAVYVRGALDSLYNGDWVSIAAIEGNRIALFNKATRIMSSTKTINPFLIVDSKSNLKNAIPFFEASMQLGYQPAEQKIDELGDEYGQFQSIKTDIKYRKIHCGIRVY